MDLWAKMIVHHPGCFPCLQVWCLRTTLELHFCLQCSHLDCLVCAHTQTRGELALQLRGHTSPCSMWSAEVAGFSWHVRADEFLAVLCWRHRLCCGGRNSAQWPLRGWPMLGGAGGSAGVGLAVSGLRAGTWTPSHPGASGFIYI